MQQPKGGRGAANRVEQHASAAYAFSSVGTESSSTPANYSIVYDGAIATIYDNTHAVMFTVDGNKYYIPFERRDSSVADITSVYCHSAGTDIYVNGHHNDSDGWWRSGDTVGIVVAVDLKNASGTVLNTEYNDLISAPSDIYAAGKKAGQSDTSYKGFGFRTSVYSNPDATISRTGFSNTSNKAFYVQTGSETYYFNLS